MLTATGMYVKRSLGKLMRAFTRSPTMKKIAQLVDRVPFLPLCLEKLPPLTLLVLCAYMGCGISSYLLDAFIFMIVLTALGVILYNVQDMLLYFPTEPNTGRILVPPADQVLNTESVTIPTSDGTLCHAFLFKHDRQLEKPTIIMYHGNAGNIGYRVENAGHLVRDCAVNVLLVEYRGYGRSGGTPSEAGLCDDAVSAVRYIKNRKDLDPNKIILLGRSLGGAVAIATASHPECSDLLAVIVENTFTSLPDIAKKVINISLIKMIPEWCYKNKYPSLQRIRSVRQPILFLSGRSDDLIPPPHMDALYTACGSVKKSMSSFPKGTHNGTWTEPGYFFAIHNFIQCL